MDLTTLSRSQLLECNVTELLVIAKKVLDADLGRHLSELDLVDRIAGDEEVDEEEDLCPTAAIRQEMDDFLHANIRFLQQKPMGCDAHCASWGCPAFLAIVHRDDLRTFMV